MPWNPFRRRKQQEPDNQKPQFEASVLYKPKQIRKVRPRINIKFDLPRIFWGMLLFVILSIIITLVYFFVRDPYFTLKQYKILGNRNITEEQLLNSLAEYSGRHLFLVETHKVENKLISAYPIIDGVDVDKIWPDKLFIKISEREPKLVYVNLNGAYLVDDEGRVLQLLTPKNLVDYNDSKMRIARGYGNEDDELVIATLQNEFLAKLNLKDKTEAEKAQILSEQFDILAVPLEDKQRTLSYLQELYLAEAQSFWNVNSKLVDLSKYSSFPRVKVLNNNELQENDQVDLDRLNLTLEISNFMTQRQIPVIDIIWEGELLVKVESLENRQLIFGLSRKSSLQFEDLLLVINDLSRQGKSYTVIDVSATKVLVVH